MPTYDYACGRCGGFDAIRSIARRDEPAACPGCGAASARVIVAAPQLACLDGATRTALATNERAQHAPKSSQEEGAKRLRHPPGCGCCGKAGRGATLRAPNGDKAFPTKRPWMISH